MEIKKILETEFSEQFVQYMKNRMVQSFFKYGSVKGTFLKVNHIESLSKRLEKYKEDGNTEWLVDVANMAMIEFMIPSHPKAHFRATSSEESPGRVSTKDGKLTNRKNDLL